MEIVNILMNLSALVVLEIILGIDNLVFLSIMTEKLPKHQRRNARRWGLTFAWVTRLLLLAFAVVLVKFTKPLISFFGYSFSARDIFLFIGGAFLIMKATQEIHNEVVQNNKDVTVSIKKVSFVAVIIQVALMDIIFSIDSVLTAVGLTSLFWVMALAITIAILVMIFASEPVSNFITEYPTIKMLALSFLLLIGAVLLADSFHFHIPRAYIYTTMGFSLTVEALNHVKRRRSKT